MTLAHSNLRIQIDIPREKVFDSTEADIEHLTADLKRQLEANVLKEAAGWTLRPPTGCRHFHNTFR